jgi:hypothetical protein
VSDAAANLLSFIPSLGTGEVFAFGAGVALPTRMKFKELPPALRPNSEAGGIASAAVPTTMDRNLVGSVIDRWRASTMSQRVDFDDAGANASAASWRDNIAPVRDDAPLQPGTGFEPQRPSIEAQRPSILRKPLATAADTPIPPAAPRWR